MMKEEQLVLTAVLRNGGCSASYDSFVQGSAFVLRLNICAKIRHYAKPQNVIGYVRRQSVHKTTTSFDGLKIFLS